MERRQQRGRHLDQPDVLVRPVHLGKGVVQGGPQLGQGPGQLHAGRPAADHGEVDGLARARDVQPLQPVHDVIAQHDRVAAGVQADGVLGGTGHAVVRGGHPGAQDQVVVVEHRAVGERDPAPGRRRCSVSSPWRNLAPCLRANTRSGNATSPGFSPPVATWYSSGWNVLYLLRSTSITCAPARSAPSPPPARRSPPRPRSPGALRPRDLAPRRLIPRKPPSVSTASRPLKATAQGGKHAPRRCRCAGAETRRAGVRAVPGHAATTASVCRTENARTKVVRSPNMPRRPCRMPARRRPTGGSTVDRRRGAPACPADRSAVDHGQLGPRHDGAGPGPGRGPTCPQTASSTASAPGGALPPMPDRSTK